MGRGHKAGKSAPPPQSGGPKALFFFLVGLEFELRASHLQSRHSTTLATPLVHLTMVILKMGSLELFAGAGLEP
jgi:hypothetical protein